jgi:SPX domain protein involved in polyphosphate accumulation
LLSSLPQSTKTSEDEKDLSQATQLQRQIETTIEDLKRNYAETLSSIASLKKKVNNLEQKTSENDSTHYNANREKLSLAVNELDQFIDSVISQTAKTRQKCERLKLECSMQSLEPVGLKELLSLCSENEQLAKDLLCYSLGRLNK